MVDKTPIKIIAIILIPLVIAAIVRFTTLDRKDQSDKNPDKNENPGIIDPDRKVGANVIISWLLPKSLLEVSGIAWLDADHFACVQDELGKVFIFNVRQNKIDQEIPFGPNGDYEGIAVVGETIYVLRADGVLFGIENYSGDKRSVKMYKTRLSKKQDSESLAYDEKNKRLLIAAKEVSSESSDFKGIYAFDLTTKTMPEAPVFKIDLKHEIFGDIKKGKAKNSISPSDIDIHPINGNLYILEGTKPKLLIMSPEGKMLSLYELDEKDFPQPEGISFGPDGKLYISNEGNKKEGNILQVELLNK
ncbi:SdiA-regulated domain-containing protein [Daejeonella sp.]|uniref:SdiA-regulated domain-containing protein n=1 Tax=Daejeonella sp. TaxID=2805397 RepID=UPI003983912D